jgi:hypothetical protein
VVTVTPKREILGAQPACDQHAGIKRRQVEDVEEGPAWAAAPGARVKERGSPAVSLLESKGDGGF